jgi:hypothetical protein
MGRLAMGKCKNKTTNSIYCHEKDEPQIYRTCDKRLSFGNVQTWMEFSKQHASLKRPFPNHYFTNFLKDLLIEALVALCELLTTKIAKYSIRLYAIPSKWAWVS